jgi:hypothetical protein
MNLSPLYLEAEAAARPNLDRPDHTALSQILEMGVRVAGALVATTSDADNLPFREALPRAARILDPNTYVKVSMFDHAAIDAAVHSTCPVMRRFGAAQQFIGTIGDRGDLNLPPIDFTDLQPDGDVIYVPYVEGAPENTTVESVAKAEAAAAAGVDIPTAVHTPGPAIERGAPASAGNASGDDGIIDINSIRPGSTASVITKDGADTTLPFAVDQSHALDSLPVGTIATKVSDTTLNVDHPDKGLQGHTIDASDVLTHLPVGSTVAVIETKTGDVPGKSVMVSLPANGFREEIGVIGKGVHDAIARAWHWIKDEALAVEGVVKKVL